jgi:hypothetical protein
LGSYAFGKCNLSGVTIPQTTKYIGYAPFYDNSLMTDITVNANNPNYCSYFNALYNKSKTILYQLPGNWQEGVFAETLQRVYQYAATGYKFSSLYLPYNLKILEQYAFQNSKNLKLVHFPSSVTTINANAFAGCDAINQVEFNTVIPPAGDIFPAVTDKSSVKLYTPREGYDAYAASAIWSQYNRQTGTSDHINCWDITTGRIMYTVITNSPYNYNGFSGDGSLRLVRFEPSSNLERFDIDPIAYAGKLYVPTTIGVKAAHYHTSPYNLFSIGNGTSITDIEEKAFENSYLLNFPFTNVETIWGSAFETTYSLSTVPVLPKLRTIAGYAFYGSGITSFEATTTLESIGMYAFYNCSNLHEIFLPHIDGENTINCYVGFIGNNASDFKCWVDYRRLGEYVNIFDGIYPHLKLDSEWQSFACVKDIDFSSVNNLGLQTYTVSAYDQNQKKATLTEVTNLKADNGAVVHGDPNTYYRLKYASDGETSSWMVGVTGSSQGVNSDNTTSCFKLNATAPQFDKITGNTTFNRGYAYLKIPTNQTGGATTIYTNFGSGAIPGDVNGDGEVTAADITALYDVLLNNDYSQVVNGDQTGDNIITAADVTAVYTILLSN